MNRLLRVVFSPAALVVSLFVAMPVHALLPPFNTQITAACSNGAYRVTLAWDAVPDATSYVVHASPASSGTSGVYTLPATQHTWSESGLDRGTVHSYYLQAITPADEAHSIPPPVDLPVDVCPVPLDAPEVTAFANCALTPPPIDLSFSAGMSATSFSIYRDGTLLQTVPAQYWNTTRMGGRYRDTPPAGNIKYTYTVRAENSMSNASTSVSATSCPLPPVVTPAVTSCDATAATVHLSWTPWVAGSSYTVYRDGASLTTLLPGTPPSYDDTTARAGHSYTYLVSATLYITVMSPPATVKTCDLLPAPPSLTASLVSCGEHGALVHLAWPPAAGATSYTVSRDGSDLGVVAASAPLTFDDSNAPAGHTYRYVVRASNSYGTTPSAEKSVTTCPVQPYVRAVSQCLSGLPVIGLTWQPIQGTLQYTVVRDGIAVGQSRTASFQDRNITAPASYSYVVRSDVSGTADSQPLPVRTFTCAQAHVDLAAVDIAPKATSLAAGDHADFTLSISNVGDAAASASVAHVRLGATPESPLPEVVGTIDVPALAGAATLQLEGSITVPATLAPGTWYLFVTVDEENLTGDVNVTNNVAHSAAIAVGPRSPSRRRSAHH